MLPTHLSKEDNDLRYYLKTKIKMKKICWDSLKDYPEGWIIYLRAVPEKQ
jgi:hypothetical protein